MRAQIRITVLSLALLAAGCQDPYRDAPRPTAATPQPAAGRDAVIHDFATRWINWDWQSMPEQQRALARLASPNLARRLRAAGSSARVAATVSRDRPGSRGRLVLIRMTSARDGLVLTQEETLTDGHADLRGEHYRVYLVSATELHGEWKVRRWEPQP